MSLSKLEQLLNEYQGLSITIKRESEWENLSGEYPDYAIIPNDGKSNTFGYYLYSIDIPQTLIKNYIKVTSKYSFEEAASLALSALGELRAQRNG